MPVAKSHELHPRDVRDVRDVRDAGDAGDARYAVNVRVTGVLIESGAILIVRQTLSESRRWSLPGGRVEAGETLGDSTVREIEEETGLQTRITRLLYLCDKLDSDPPIVHVTFEVERCGGAIRMPTNEHDENPIFDVRIVPLDRLTEYDFSPRFQSLAKAGFPNAGSYMGPKSTIGL